MSSPYFRLTQRQEQAQRLLGTDATHTMLFGGSRSGKTFLLIKAIITRALAYKSNHAVFRFRFNHIKSSVVLTTLPEVMQKCYPQVLPHCHLDKSDWYYTLPNGSRIWFGGLDDKERTEKVLGNEFSTIFLNECSQIPLSARQIALTRLAENVGLRLKMYYDCNPPTKVHWTYKMFVQKVDPISKKNLPDHDNYCAMKMNPQDNADNLQQTYLDLLQNMDEKNRKRFWEGEFTDVTQGALWYVELLEQQRILDGKIPDMQRIVVAVDPSGCAGEDDKRSDEVGIVVCGLGIDGKGYVIEDLSGQFSASEWPVVVDSAYQRHSADCVVAEVNYGGDMVRAVVQAVNGSIPFRPVTATRGKVVRAEPISYLYEQGKINHIGYFPELEEQLCSMTSHGYLGSNSPDRADAMVWGMTALFPEMVKDKTILRSPHIRTSHSGARRKYQRH